MLCMWDNNPHQATVDRILLGTVPLKVQRLSVVPQALNLVKPNGRLHITDTTKLKQGTLGVHPACTVF